MVEEVGLVWDGLILFDSVCLGSCGQLWAVAGCLGSCWLFLFVLAVVGSCGQLLVVLAVAGCFCLSWQSWQLWAGARRPRRGENALSYFPRFSRAFSPRFCDRARFKEKFAAPRSRVEDTSDGQKSRCWGYCGAGQCGGRAGVYPSRVPRSHMRALRTRRLHHCVLVDVIVWGRDVGEAGVREEDGGRRRSACGSRA
jgi:hypothetical protein